MATAKLSKKEASHLSRCLTDFPYYASNHLWIVPKNEPIKKFKLNRAQRIVHDKLTAQKKEKGYVRAIILKARQEGISTMVAGRFFRNTTLRPYRKAMVLAHKDKASESLFAIYERYHKNLAEEMDPGRQANARGRYLEFENQSVLTVETAGDPEAGRSQTVHYLHASEMAMWPNASSVWNAVEETVPMHGSEIIIESTAKGIGNVFHEMWLQAESGESDFIAIFLPWWIHEEYTVQLTKEERDEILNSTDPYERKCMDEGFEYEGKVYKLTPEQLAWRRMKIRNKRGNERDFRQENPATPREAFVVSGSNFFDVDALEMFEPRDPMIRGMLVELEGDKGTYITVQPNERGWLRMWEGPKADHLYSIGADTAYGAQGRQAEFTEEDYKGRGDFSCAYVFDITTRRVVAELHGRIAPDAFAKQLNWLGHFYGSNDHGVAFPATLAVERNHESGVTVIKRLQEDYRYAAMYYSRSVAVKKRNRPTVRCGWVTSAVTRGPMLDELAESIAAHRYPDDELLSAKAIWIPSVECLNELLSFIIVYDDKGQAKRAEAQEGAHDDRVLALAITLQASQSVATPPAESELPEQEEGSNSPTGFDYGYEW